MKIARLHRYNCASTRDRCGSERAQRENSDYHHNDSGHLSRHHFPLTPLELHPEDDKRLRRNVSNGPDAPIGQAVVRLEHYLIEHTVFLNTSKGTGWLVVHILTQRSPRAEETNPGWLESARAPSITATEPAPLLG
jgi:hypothetical protein